MGLGGIGIWQLLVILVIVIMIFGTKRLKNIGGDLGGAIKGFKQSLSEDETKEIENAKSGTDDSAMKAEPAQTKSSADSEQPKS